MNKPKQKYKFTYLYGLKTVWRVGALTFVESIEEYKHLARNVVRLPDGSFEFDLLSFDPSRRFRTRYGWSLILNTPDNLQRLAAYREARHAAEAAEERCSVIRRGMITLQEE